MWANSQFILLKFAKNMTYSSLFGFQNGLNLLDRFNPVCHNVSAYQPYTITAILLEISFINIKIFLNKTTGNVSISLFFQFECKLSLHSNSLLQSSIDQKQSFLQ